MAQIRVCPININIVLTVATQPIISKDVSAKTF